MEKEKQTRYMELDVPQEAITEVAELIGESEIEATILGTCEEESISIGFDYTSEQRESMMEILELIEDYNTDEDSEEEEEKSETEED